jgi:hypothetical protein
VSADWALNGNRGTLGIRALANTMENFSDVFRQAWEGIFIDRMEQNEETTAKFMIEA